MGRPRKDKNLDYEQLERVYTSGCTDAQVAAMLNINRDTIYQWKKDNPEFAKSLKNWKEHADSKVERSLFERATGWEEPVQNLSGGEIVPSVKQHAPDTTACIFWLKNRKRNEWRDKVEVDANIDDAKSMDDLKKEIGALVKELGISKDK